ncbi:hypothetical protein C8R45DRAFT_1161009 [Mycena sanguinolenta]|nr:hypothetical protein C8R45DRAFT_1161009 [Mycena sanguinolenta]
MAHQADSGPRSDHYPRAEKNLRDLSVEIDNIKSCDPTNALSSQLIFSWLTRDGRAVGQNNSWRNKTQPRDLSLGRRTLRSGKEFSAFVGVGSDRPISDPLVHPAQTPAAKAIAISPSDFAHCPPPAFDLAIGPPISPPQFFSVADCLKQRLDAQYATRIFAEPAEIVQPSHTSSPTPLPSPLAALTPSPPPSPVASGSRDLPAHLDDSLPAIHLDRLAWSKKGSKRWRQQKRSHEATESSDPELKQIHQQWRDAAKKNAVQVDVTPVQLPHIKKAWIGKLRAEDGSEAPPIGSQPTLPPGLEQHSYMQQEIDQLTGTTRFTYINWPGK